LEEDAQQASVMTLRNKKQKDKTIMYNKSILTLALAATLLWGCNLPPREKDKSTLREKHNYIVLLDLSDRLIVEKNQPERDKEIIRHIYSVFEEKVKKDLYIKSRDEMRVAIAPQMGSRVDRDEFEDRLYVNMKNIQNVYRRAKEKERREDFFANLDTLYSRAVFSKNPEHYHGADIWKYFYEDLKVDYSTDSLTQNFLFILTDGYPIVGSNPVKLRDIKDSYPGLHVILLEASPREKDMEWDRVAEIWKEWFDKIGVENYTLIKRGAISKELEQIREVLTEKKAT